MLKIFGFIRRRHDLDFAAFSQHWRTTHRAHALTLDRWLKGYKQAHLLPGPIPDMQRPADGCPILWVERAEDMVELAASPEFREGAFLDEPRFMEGRSSGLAVREEMILPPPAAHVRKLMLFVGLGLGETDEETPLWSTARAAGHVRNRALPGQQLDPVIAFDRVEEIWWTDEAAYQADLADSLPFPCSPSIDPRRCRAALADELVVIPPP